MNSKSGQEAFDDSLRVHDKRNAMFKKFALYFFLRFTLGR